MNEKLIEKIIEKIAEASKDFETIQSKILLRASNLKMNYRFGLERPIAGHTNSYLINKIPNSLLMHEFPISGIDKKIKDEKIKQGIKETGIKISDISKKYSRFDVDGYLLVKELDKYYDFFIEYKVSDKFHYILLVMDYIKYLIYTSNSNEETYFIYVNYKKEKNNKKLLTLNNKPNFKILKKNHIMKLLSNESLDRDILVASSYHRINKIKANNSLVQLSKFKEKIPESENLMVPHDDVESDDKFEKSKELKNKEIYGLNVLFSYKMRNNISKLKKCYSNIIEVEGYNSKEKREDLYTEIKIFISKLKAEKVGDNSGDDAAKKTINQSTNWLLAFLEAGIKESWPNIYKKHVGDSEIKDKIFDIREVLANGGRGKKLHNYTKMINKASIKNKEHDKKYIYFVIRHIIDAYNLTVDYESEMDIYEVPDDKQNYKNYKKRIKVLNNLNSLGKSILKKKNINFIIKDFYGDSLSTKLQNFSKKIIENILILQ